MYVNAFNDSTDSTRVHITQQLLLSCLKIYIYIVGKLLTLPLLFPAGLWIGAYLFPTKIEEKDPFRYFRIHPSYERMKNVLCVPLMPTGIWLKSSNLMWWIKKDKIQQTKKQRTSWCRSRAEHGRSFRAWSARPERPQGRVRQKPETQLERPGRENNCNNTNKTKTNTTKITRQTHRDNWLIQFFFVWFSVLIIRQKKKQPK